MKILGKILLLGVFVSLLEGGVSVRFSENKIYKGDSVDLIIESDLEKTEFPQFQAIGGLGVEGVSSYSNVIIMNGKRTNKIRKIYRFTPTKTFTLNSFEVKTSEGVIQTDPITIEVVPPKETKEELFAFRVSVNKKKLYVGEPFVLTLTFDYDKRLSLANLYYDSNNLKDTLQKSLETNWRKEQNLGRVSYTNEIIIKPTKQGDLNLGNQRIVAQFMENGGNSFFGRKVQKGVVSNPLQMVVNPPRTSEKLVGVFTIKAKVDKKKATPKEGITGTYVVEGEGDLEGFELEFPKIDGVTIFPDKSKFSSAIVDKKLYSKKIFKVALAGEESFTIPAVTLQYFDTEKEKVVVKKSDQFFIDMGKKKEIKGDQKEKLLLAKETSKKEDLENRDSFYLKYLYGVFGFVLGISLFLAISLMAKTRNKNHSFGIKSRKKLYNELLPFGDKKEVFEILKALEEEFYRGKKSQIKTKDLNKLIGDLKKES